MDIDAKLAEHGLTLPPAPQPVASYVPFVVSGNLVFISGQVPLRDGAIAYVGKVGADMDEAIAQEAAQLCALNILAQLGVAVEGDFSRVRRVVRLGGFVNCVDGFGNQPEVINAASDLMEAVFGTAGKHARAAVGVNALPRGVPVEVDAIFEIS